MFGVGQRAHDERYAFAQEWLDVVMRAWTEAGTFDVAGDYLALKGVRAFPKPFGGTRPIIMNAGSSATGQAFALKNCDAYFTANAASRVSLDAAVRKVDEIKAQARALGREIEVFTVGQVVCRPTQKEAEEYYRHTVIDSADWGAVDGMLALKDIRRETMPIDEYEKKRRYFAGNAIGGYPYVGTPDRVAEELANVSRSGMRGIAISFVNYLNEIPYFCDEVLPRLVRLGVRELMP
jgi:alkanesulfonate monooxygenase SsuD/methylene tetrahydromethanopterin reductase-like flavin-dependent oxidoreductase (luciferase family)